MRIVHITNFYVPASLGGAEVSCHELAVRQRAAGHDVRVITNMPGVRFAERNVVNLDLTVNPVELGLLLSDRSVSRSLKSALSAYAPDVVHLHNTHETLGFAAYTACAPYASVATMHDYNLFCLRTDNMRVEGRACDDRRWCWKCAVHFYPAKAAERFPGRAKAIAAGKIALSPALVAAPLIRNTGRRRRFEQYVDIVICPSNAMRRTMEVWGVAPAKLRVLPNVVGVTAQPSTTGKPRDGVFTFGYIGKLTRAKGVHVLLEAFARLGAAKPAKLIVAGDGPDQEQLRRQALPLENVTFLGRLERAELERFYDAVQVVVVPSIWPENLPNVVFEAMERGKAVIAADIGGLPDQVADAGMLVRANDALALSAALALLVENPDLAQEFGRLGQRRFQTEFAADEIFARHERLYREVLECRNR